MNVTPLDAAASLRCSVQHIEESSLLKHVSSLTEKQTSQLKAQHEGVDSDTACVWCPCGSHK